MSAALWISAPVGTWSQFRICCSEISTPPLSFKCHMLDLDLLPRLGGEQPLAPKRASSTTSPALRVTTLRGKWRSSEREILIFLEHLFYAAAVTQISSGKSSPAGGIVTTSPTPSPPESDGRITVAALFVPFGWVVSAVHTGVPSVPPSLPYQVTLGVAPVKR